METSLSEMIDDDDQANGIEHHRIPKNLLTQSVDEKRRFMQSFDHILADCDGTVWKFEHALDGVGKAIAKLEQFGKQIIYVSNNSMRSDAEYVSKFKASGIELNIKNVIHPAIATVEYLKQRNFRGLVYTIGSPAYISTIQAAGFKTIDGPHEMGDGRFSSMWKFVKDDQPVEAVVMDTDADVDLRKLVRAQLYLTNPECLFIVGATDMILDLGLARIMGPGNFYKCLEQTVGRKAVIVGKPGQDLVGIIESKYELSDRRRVLFIGDVLEQDIGFAKAAGFQSLVVLTGETTLENLQSHNQLDKLPDYYLISLADFSIIIDELSGV